MNGPPNLLDRRYKGKITLRPISLTRKQFLYTIALPNFSRQQERR